MHHQMTARWLPTALARPVSIALAALLAAVLGACDSGETPAPACAAGATQACVCTDGASGAQLCDDDGSGFGACTCTAPEPEPEPDESVEPPADAGPPDGELPGDMESTDGGLPDRGPVDAEVQCADDDGCPGAQGCVDGRCIEPEMCEADLDCLDDRLCVDGACAAPCADDDGCPGTRVCVDARCVESAACDGPEDCDPGRVCVDGACDDACSVRNPCPDGQLCAEDGLCAEDPDGCEDDLGCRGIRLCVGGACTDPCMEDAACPGNRACVDGLCPEAEPCLVAEDCDADRACVEGACRPACGALLPPCPDQLICDDGLGACRPDDRCRADDACPAGTWCADARCVQDCVEDADCPGNRPCDVARGRCVEADPCLAPEDCDAGRVCERFTCVSACGRDADCPGAQRCDLESARCREPERCGDDVDCLGERRCQGGVCDDPCAAHADCPGAQRCDGDRCVGAEPCAGDDDCPGRERCRAGQCQAPDCEADADCPGGVCVDTVCAPRPPYTCADAEGCPLEQICAPVGACAPDGACDGDGDCPARAPTCDPLGRCVACVVDAQCAGAETCIDGVCALDRRCDGDADCPGSRVCQAGICAPAGDCADDGRGDLRPPEVLGLRVYAGLVWCDDTRDRFRVEVPAGQGRVITLRHPTEAGDLALEVTAAGEPAMVLGEADTVYGFERVVVPPEAAARAVDVRITGRAGFDTPYALHIEALPDGACPPDALEGLLGNDTAETATPVDDGVEATELVLCPGERDWLALPATIGVDWRIRATPSPQAEVQLLLTDPGGEIVAQGEAIDGASVLNFGPVADGLHRLRITAPDAAEPVAVRLTISRESSPEAGPRACAAPPTLRPGEPLPVRATLDRLDITCGDGPDAVATFELDAPTRIDLSLVGSADPFGTALALRQACAGAADLSCAPAGAAIGNELLPAGRFYVVAKVPPGGDPRLLLDVARPCDAGGGCPGEAACVEGLCADGCRGDDDCPGAQTCAGGQCAAPAVCDVDADCPGLTACERGACVAFECNADADCPGVCVDRRCADAPPGACGADDPCPGALLCAPLGACLPDGPCAADADCPVGAPRCDALAGRCARCLVDADCPGAGFCEDQACVYGGFCFDAADCPGDQACGRDGACALAECAPDRFDALPLAQRPPVLDRRTYADLMRCDGAVDTFRAVLGEGEGLQVVLRHDPAAGDLRLRLVDDTGRTVEADSPYGAERLAVDGAAGATRVDIEVDGAAGRSTPYSLSLAPLEPGVCAPDPSEGLLDNDAIERATPIAPGNYALGLCPGDVDYLALGLDAGTRLVVDALWDRGGADSGVFLRGPDGVRMAEGRLIPGGDLRLDTVIERGGAYAIELAAGDVAGEGRLSVLAAAADEGAALACADALPLVAGEPRALPRRAAVDRFALSCGRGRETEYVGVFELAAPAAVDITLEGDPIGAAFSVRGDCVDGAGEALCAERGVEGLALEAGRWFVVVETGPTLGPPALRLTVR